VPEFDVVRLLGGRAARRLDRFVQIALVAAREAVAGAGLDPATWDGTRVAVVLGCAEGGFSTVEQQYRVLTERGPGRVSPLLMPMQLPNMLAACVSLELGATGPSMVVTTACAAGTTAIGLALDLLANDRCDVVLTGGSESAITPLLCAGMARMGALSRRACDPDAASRPFDVERDGFVAGEGAAILVLERPADARARGAHVHAQVIGFGASADAYHITGPDPGGLGIERALRAALKDAQVCPADIDHVNAHAAGTPQGDVVEAGALGRVFGDHAVVTSTKGVTGHLFGAAGAVEAAFTVLAIEHGVVPPTANLQHQDPEVTVDVATTARVRRLRLAVNSSFGFGGQNAALVLGAA
jgi:3-oxoacyl-[acyl-carrier-protein] synthase II